MDKYDVEYDDIYCYKGTNTLINKLNIKDEDTLENAERDITAISIKNIEYIFPPYDLEYLKKLHKTLFENLYDWAGEIRRIDISKGGTRFCTASRIESEAQKLFIRLEKESYLQEISKEIFYNRLAEYYADFNVLHPFREGNGRVQRLFFEHLAAYNGYYLDWSHISSEEWIQANIDGYNIHYESLVSIFKRILGNVPKVLKLI